VTPDFLQSVFSLKGRAALVAGASRGIGLAIAKGVAGAGARTILAARSIDDLEREAASMRDAGSHVEAAHLDMTDRESIRRLAAAYPEVDILFNVAGTNRRRRFETYSREEYDWLLQTNLHGIVELTQLVGARMIERGKGGKVITIGSLMSVLGLPYMTVYAITKSALAGMTRVLAAEWARHNIQVNCIVPGFIRTDLNRHLWEIPEMVEWVKSCEANPEIGKPEDVAPLAVFLAGPGSDYITGQLIAVDGGFTTTAMWPMEPLTTG
jgi:gluconate 5-dehydrogenase